MEIEAQILAERASEPLVPFHSEVPPPPAWSTQSGQIQVAAAVVAIPPIIVYGPPAAAFLYGAYETYMMSLEHPSSPIMQKSGDEADGPSGEESKEGEKEGTIYKVHGDSTPSGKPYIGRHKGPNPQKTRKSPDGRDRTKADTVDRYKSSSTREGRTREQQAIDREGGVDKLDNKRNEIAPSRRGDYGL